MADSTRIVLAKPQWREQLTDMWAEAFGDSREQIGLFHAYFPVEQHAWCYVEKDSPLSVIYALPAYKWKTDGTKQALWYLYAGATRASDRSLGYYGALIRAVCAMARKEGNFRVTVLVPVSELIPYYEKLGFVVLENGEAWNVSLDSEGQDDGGCFNGACLDIEAYRYKELRDLRFGRPGYVEWDVNYLGYALESLRQECGLAIEVMTGGGNHFLLGKAAENCLMITETSLSPRQLSDAGVLLKEKFGCSLAEKKETLLMSYGQRWEEKPYFDIALGD